MQGNNATSRGEIKRLTEVFLTISDVIGNNEPENNDNGESKKIPNIKVVHFGVV